MTTSEIGVSAQAPVGGIDSETLRRAIALARAWRDPALPGFAFLLLLAVTGSVVLVITVVATTGTPYVALQLPYVISGGFGGVALVAIGALLAAVQAERHDRVAAIEQTREVVDEVCALTGAALRRYRD
ncbi:hypothetical protein [Haloechinothrix halophila]|uniref:hypothetical protein n=1 Tax=Haloechinothrix halophila TaxID=1069073 RepID=UPI00041ACED1|nr:hypothetical protein [Haloechinothrix halophila]